MKIDELIKKVFEGETERHRSRIPPFRPVPHVQNQAEWGSTKLDLGVAACFCILLMVSLLFIRHDMLSSPLIHQDIARFIPENPGETLYEFLYASGSSFRKDMF